MARLLNIFEEDMVNYNINLENSKNNNTIKNKKEGVIMGVWKFIKEAYEEEAIAQGRPIKEIVLDEIWLITKGLLWLAFLPLIILFYCAKICLGAVD